ncbi:hypothetical protein G6F66_014928 [Rhizopus arrhizus]|nr:hypothetical protein G6F66_014928 [Rhizopus arrhizus]
MIRPEASVWIWPEGPLILPATTNGARSMVALSPRPILASERELAGASGDSCTTRSERASCEDQRSTSRHVASASSALAAGVAAVAEPAINRLRSRRSSGTGCDRFIVDPAVEVVVVLAGG